MPNCGSLSRRPTSSFLDWMLPGVTGSKSAPGCGRATRTRSLPVIMLTARAEEAERVQGFSVSGADDYVVKPFR